MTPSVGKKLSLFVALVALLAVAVVGTISYQLLEARFAQILRKDTLDAATLLSSRVRNELRHIGEKGRILSAAALQEFRNPDDQIKFLEDNLSIDDQMISLSLFRRSKASSGEWIPVFRLVRPDGDPAHLGDEDFKDLDLKYPIDLKRVAEGATEVTVGSLRDNTPVLRLAVPIVRRKGEGFTQLLSMEVRQEKIMAAFAEATAHFSFILDRHGRVITQTDPTHFTFGEDLSHLPIFQMANSTDAPNGNLDYYELPGGTLQYGSYHKVGYADLVVVTQAPRTHVITVLRGYTRQALLMGAICVLLAAAFGLLASWGIVGARLRRIGATLMRIGDGRFSVHFADRRSQDEIGVFAETLQRVCDQLQEREHVHGTYAKLKNRKLKAKLHEGKINIKGERTKAMVLHCHLHGIEQVVAKAEPETLLSLLNKFNQQTSDAVEHHQGIVDHIHGGSVVAYWGVPVADKEDADHALSTCLEIRKFAKQLNDALKKSRLPQVTLTMGMHYGTVVAGQVGTADRMEYTALGEAIEIASRIQSFTDQFGTDFLMTGPAVDQAPKWYSTEKVSSGDENQPELYELVGTVARGSVEASAPAGEPGHDEETAAGDETEAQDEAATAGDETEAQDEAAADADAETADAAAAGPNADEPATEPTLDAEADPETMHAPETAGPGDDQQAA